MGLCCSYKMLVCFRIFIIAVFILVGLFPALTITTLENRMKIEIFHSHENGLDHHTHEVTTETDPHPLEATSSGFQQTPPHKDEGSSNQHSHEIFISGAHVFTVTDKMSLVDTYEFKRIFPNSSEQRPPRSRYLVSIFRPPILA